VCSKNVAIGKGNRSNQTKLGVKYPIAEPLDAAKEFNFYTSTAFEGCDIHDKDGRIIIVSDSNKRHTMLDISTLVIQICGRIRDTYYNTEVTHIFNTSESRYNNLSLEEFTERKNKNLNESKERLTASAYTQKLYMGVLTPDQLNNMYINMDADGNYYLDENLVKLDVANFKIVNHIYRSVYLLRDEYINNGFNFRDSWRADKELFEDDPSEVLNDNPKARITFKNCFKEYADLKAAVVGKPGFTFGLERIAVIDNTRPDVKKAYDKLGPDKVKELDYSTSKINRAYIDLDPNINLNTKIVKCLAYTPGTTVTGVEIRTKLQEIYDELELKDNHGRPKKATATDLANWYECKPCKMMVDEKQVRCFTIISNKLIFK
jgi:hypothetical protein